MGMHTPQAPQQFRFGTWKTVKNGNEYQSFFLNCKEKKSKQNKPSMKFKNATLSLLTSLYLGPPVSSQLINHRYSSFNKYT